ncbi:GT2 family glycosyltransferase [Rathayibacter sp. PhB93]|uniref:glycosyltransferase family 2 protein n=1 Tax=unclassified Rathayibacter TaxID=2609250 RepID=UPI000F90FECA|nr:MULTISPECIES: glycosyltransferase [unclassified Rathayibacter]ROQ15522.1 GT2 family glycosyltransferase [Rathayibacter sp. PhB93]TDQ15460.1 GT2 family glycosyltransferase [Rathayibacter sp. PhB1]
MIVPSYAGADRLPRLLTALAAQSHAELEVVVVLDGVVDGSERVLDGFPVRRVVLPENRGRSAALNAGFAAATGAVLIRCDDDLEPPPGWAAAHVAAHAGDPVGVVGLCPNAYPDSAYARAYGRDADARFRAHAAAAHPESTWRLWGGNVSVTRAVFDRVGGYGTEYREYGWEDVDWGYRLHRLGLPVRLVPGAEALHHGASTSTAIRSRRAFLSGAARRTFERLHPEEVGPPAPPAGVWDRAVGALARVETEERLARLAGGIDAVLPAVPRAIGRKLVALAVESAASAGYRRAARR